MSQVRPLQCPPTKIRRTLQGPADFLFSGRGRGRNEAGALRWRVSEREASESQPRCRVGGGADATTSASATPAVPTKLTYNSATANVIQSRTSVSPHLGQ